MKYKFFIGIDLSKHWLDAALINTEIKEKVQHIQVQNTNSGMTELLNWLKSFEGYAIEETLFCMEHTGLYNYAALKFLIENACAVWIENPTHIKKSLGMKRGKNDKIDAERIAQFALRNMDQVRLWQPVREVLTKIRHLTSLRERLIDSKKRLLVPIEEFKTVGNNETARMLEISMAHAIKGIEKDIELTEKQIKDIIDSDHQLKKLFNLITSVVGIGFVSAVNLLIYTNEFKLFADAKKFACYCGIAPFAYQSGSSVKGRTKVSHLANKKVKTLLHMASLTAIKLDLEIREYYQRKVIEGKNKMSVLNAVRNKLISRVFAVVNRETGYVKNILSIDLVLS